MDEEFDRKIRIALATKIIGIIILFSFNKFQNFLFLQTSSFSKLKKVRRVMNKRQLLLILARSGSEFRYELEQPTLEFLKASFAIIR